MAQAKKTVAPVTQTEQPALLSQLTFLTDAPARPGTTATVMDATERRRTNFVASLKTQIEVAKALQEGNAYFVTMKHYVTVRGPDGKPKKNAEGKIERVLKEEPVKKDAWFWLSPGDSTWYMIPWYSVRKLDLIGKGSTIKCGKNLTDVIDILNGLIEATTAKMFDRLLTSLKLGSRG